MAAAAGAAAAAGGARKKRDAVIARILPGRVGPTADLALARRLLLLLLSMRAVCVNDKPSCCLSAVRSSSRGTLLGEGRATTRPRISNMCLRAHAFSLTEKLNSDK